MAKGVPTDIDAAVPIDAPYFVYELAPELFLGRVGIGPLEVVWDTSVLVDYVEHGPAMWEGEPLDVEDEGYKEQLLALHALVQRWTWMDDVRFHVLPRSITDAKKRLSKARMDARRNAMEELGAALELDAWAEDGLGPRRVPATAPGQETLFGPADPLSQVPRGGDRDLVGDSFRMGAHVFLVRDAKVENKAAALKTCGLLLASPTLLLDEVVAYDGVRDVYGPGDAAWLFPDPQRISHIIRAMG